MVEIAPEIQAGEYRVKGAYHWKFTNRTRYAHASTQLPQSIRGTHCIDVGGGDGMMAHLLRRRGAIATIVDLDNYALHLARAKDSRVHGVQARTRLPIASGSCKAVTMLETLEHIPDRDDRETLREIARVLEPGGRLIISVPSTTIPLARKHFRHYTPDMLRTALETAGLAVIHEAGFQDVRSLWPYPGMRHKFIRGALFFVDMAVRKLTGGMGFGRQDPNNCHTLMFTAQKN